MGRTVALVGFVAAVFAAGVYCAVRPTVARGDVLAADLLESNAETIDELHCGDVRIGVDGARFHCMAKFKDRSIGGLDFTMDRDRDRIGRDSMDESTEEEIYSTQLRLHDRETFLLDKIREALRRLDAGEIDECEECSEPIGFKRLMARPVTTLCFECKTAREQVEADEEPAE